MKIAIAGGTGFIGQMLTDQLVNMEHEVIILTRKMRPSTKRVTYCLWLTDGATPEKELGNVDVFINLAGVSINDGRWSKKHQREIYESRMVATDELIRIISNLNDKPALFMNASAIGIYPTSLHTVYTEHSSEVADDFLGKTVNDWEKKSIHLEKMGIRTVLLRLGVVLGKEGGALPLMSLPYKLFTGGPVGSGRQWVSWVHVEDVIRAFIFTIEKDSLNGAINVTSPSPVRMNDFGKTIGSVLKRPHWFPTPSFLLKIALGKKSKLVLEGQQVSPSVLMENGFEFRFSQLRSALEDLF